MFLLEVLNRLIYDHSFFLQERSNFMDGSYDDGIRSDKIRHKFMEKPNLKMFVGIIRDQVILDLVVSLSI